MFEVLERNRASQFRTWLIQLILAAAAPLAVTEMLKFFLGWNEVAGSPFGNVGLQIVEVSAIGTLGFLAALAVCAAFPSAAALGRYVWIAPVAFLVFAVAWDLWTFHLDWPRVWRDYFFWSDPGSDEGPLGRDFLAYPALSSLTYSIGTLVRNRLHSDDTGSDALSPPSGETVNEKYP